MKRKIHLFVLFLFLYGFTLAQQPQLLSLDSCRALALKHNPLAQQAALYTSMQQIKDEATGHGYYPQVVLNGQATWQSDVTSLPIQIPNVDIPSLSQDNYRLSLDINQLLWDGGAIRSQQQLDVSLLEINLTEVETANLRMIELVDQTYFSILIFTEQEKLIQLAMDEIQSRLAKVRAGIDNGVVLFSNADVLDAELIGMEQNLMELRNGKMIAIYKLGALTGVQMGTGVIFELPVITDLPEFQAWVRPEFKLFSLQQKRLDDQIQMTGLKLMPRFSAFSNLGYGRPGLNMLSNSFEPFAMIGVRMNWNFWDWNITQRNKEVLGIQKQITDTQRQNWELNQDVMLNTIKQEILKIKNQLAADYRIVSLRQSVADATAAQLDSGIITASDFLTEQNALTKARLNQGINKILLQRAKLNYLTVIGFTN
ncbi:MAG: TolC family protein [Lentimicrobium sp.]|jgi:outer membrane protein TolC|nr:TolC family protein [Lentimicrobium sp.]